MSVEAIVLGIMQDGGLPQAGCGCANCSTAWADPSKRQLVGCLGLVDCAAEQGWLIDATPDFREQLRALQEAVPGCALSGIVLTHAHSGHYTGLVHLGREAMNARRIPVYATQRMAGFLRKHAPWSQLVAQQNIVLRILVPGNPVELSPRIRINAVPVPHRDEFSDTVAVMVEGPARRLFYCPDIDGWQHWDHDLQTFLADVDIALLDGTFWSADELPGRDAAEVPHPLVLDTVDRLSGSACEVRMIHLNHTNPLLAPGPERGLLAARGLGISTYGQQWILG